MRATMTQTRTLKAQRDPTIPPPKLPAPLPSFPHLSKPHSFSFHYTTLRKNHTTMESEAPQSLRTLFSAAESQRHSLANTPDPRSPDYLTNLDSTIGLYNRVLELIAGVSLFSDNEGVEDIATAEIPFLLAGFQLAELLQKLPRFDPKERRELLRRTRGVYESFLGLVDGYGLVQGTYKTLLERYKEDHEGFSIVSQTADPTVKRNSKIQAFKAEKALKDKLETLRRDPRYLENGDEELVRETYLANVAYCIHQTFNALDGMNREMEILKLAPENTEEERRKADEREQERSKDDDASWRLDQRIGGLGGGSGPILSKDGKPLQPFTLVGANSRKDMTRNVFRPGHNLPTMSIDEYLEEEKRRGNIIEGGEEPKAVIDEDDMDAADRETYKAREWDEFKDHNPKGSGNTMNMG